MLIRDYQPGDLAAVHAINQGEVPAVGDVTADALRRIAELSAVALVAEAAAGDGDTGASLAGFCLVLPPGTPYESGNYRWFSDRYADFVYLDRIAIAPSYRRRGLGRALYAEVERRVADLRPSTPWFTLEVNLQPRNATSLAFHAELGFVEVGRRTSDDGKVVAMLSKAIAAPAS